VLVERLDMTPGEFQRGTGWEIKPEGACQGDVCVPLRDGGFDATAVAEQLGMAVVHEPGAGLRALGPATLSGRSLTTTDASDFGLPDLDGRPFELSSLLGEKVLLVAWAPY
jgi:hypothetical protein